MIIKGGRRGGPRQLASHLLRRDTNEDVLIREMAHHPGQKHNDDDLRVALKLMAAQGLAKGKDRTLYHSIIAPQDGECLNNKQLTHAVDVLAKNLGMEGHHRVIIEHHKNGRQHFHVVFNILHPETGKQARLQWTKKVEWNTSRQLEAELGLKPVTPKGKAKRRWEHERGKRSGIDPLQVRRDVTAIYNASLTGKDFVAHLAKAGYVMSKGRNNAYLLVDRAGDVHGLMRRIEGAKLRDLRQKFPDLKNMALPSLGHAVKQQKAKAVRRSALARAASFVQVGNKLTGMMPFVPNPVRLVTPEIVMSTASDKPNDMQPIRTVPVKQVSGTATGQNQLPKKPKGEIGKSHELKLRHAGQWMDLAARYAGRRAAPLHEPDDEKSELMRAVIDREEEAERTMLAVKQQEETEDDINAQVQDERQRTDGQSLQIPKP